MRLVQAAWPEGDWCIFPASHRAAVVGATQSPLVEAPKHRMGRLLSCWSVPVRVPGASMKAGGSYHPEARTHLLGSKLLCAKSGAQQGPERRQKLPPRPVLDLQEHSQVLLDAVCSQPTDLQEENVVCGGSPAWERGQGTSKMEKTGPQPRLYSRSPTAQASGWGGVFLNRQSYCTNTPLGYPLGGVS